MEPIDVHICPTRCPVPARPSQRPHGAGRPDASRRRGHSRAPKRPRLSARCVVGGRRSEDAEAQNIVEMLALGSRDVGFAGADWVAELEGSAGGADVVELLDTGLDPVQLVAAAPVALLEGGQLPKRRLIVASEYERLTRRWISASGLCAEFVRSYGATEVFPPEDADVIVDNTATGATLDSNGLVIFDVLMRSSTRLYAHRASLDDPVRRRIIEDLVLLITSVLEARRRVTLEVNASALCLDAVVAVLPSMRQATVSRLFGDSGYAVKAAVPRELLPQVILAVKAAGGTDVVVSTLSQIVP